MTPHVHKIVLVDVRRLRGYSRIKKPARHIDGLKSNVAYKCAVIAGRCTSCNIPGFDGSSRWRRRRRRRWWWWWEEGGEEEED